MLCISLTWCLVRLSASLEKVWSYMTANIIKQHKHKPLNLKASWQVSPLISWKECAFWNHCENFHIDNSLMYWEMFDMEAIAKVQCMPTRSEEKHNHSVLKEAVKEVKPDTIYKLPSVAKFAKYKGFTVAVVCNYQFFVQSDMTVPILAHNRNFPYSLDLIIMEFCWLLVLMLCLSTDLI